MLINTYFYEAEHTKLTCVISINKIGPIPRNEISSSSSNHRCALYCNSASTTATSRWQYEVGKTYSYDYDVDTTTLMEGTSTQASTVKLTAKAHVHVVSSCDFELKVGTYMLHVRINPRVLTKGYIYVFNLIHIIFC